MRVELKDIVKLFEKIQEELNINYVSIVLFTALDVDSLCTLKILTRLFKSEHINYKVYPVSSYTELNDRIQEARAYDSVKIFSFINCGGIIDLTEFWIVDQQAHILLFDSNKPVHHKNLESEDIKIVEDGLSGFDACPTLKDIEKFQELIEFDLSEEEVDMEDEEDADESPKRRNNKVYKEKLRKHRDLLNVKINSYYGKHFFSNPSSSLAYQMVRDLNKANNQYLWYAIVGMTSMFLEHKMRKEDLESLSQLFRSDVNKFNVASSKQEKGELIIKKGYQFTLMNHWSLYESMQYSDYLMCKLRLWEDRGISRLHEFIHTIGVSLQEAKQLYKYMSAESMRKLEHNIVPAAEKMDLFDVAFLSFMKQVDYSAAYMASDYYHILTSVLETAPQKETPFKELPQHRIRCFWKAYDTFDGGLELLKEQVQKSKDVTKVLMTEARRILERDHLISMKAVSVANIHSDTEGRKLFEHPATLVRMAYLLLGILREREKRMKGKAYKPLIATWISSVKDICVVAGVMLESKNKIGAKFNAICDELGLDSIQDSFMANIIIIKKESLGDFLKKLNQLQG